jgi:hypothetical protein
MKELKKGDFVKLKSADLGKDLGIKCKRHRGGEGLIVGVSEDSKGTVYRIELLKNGKYRMARREQLVIHHKRNNK